MMEKKRSERSQNKRFIPRINNAGQRSKVHWQIVASDVEYVQVYISRTYRSNKGSRMDYNWPARI